MKDNNSQSIHNTANLAGVVECTDCISTEG